ncbi:retrograde transporter [Pseudozyma hubeiensis SY62]|uniref:Retrograde transporter n=1 Tax=Pseudozyma hubeiensis (strain SY62) TaxID=1305764 RepID=R9P3V8_PSEHS|nr:retrograde transporter [Pseudozyma hubeiensis SY62]GAC92770.1 retrograde transporter [Pseudozyma hubeiensis SY62]
MMVGRAVRRFGRTASRAQMDVVESIIGWRREQIDHVVRVVEFYRCRNRRGCDEIGGKGAMMRCGAMRCDGRRFGDLQESK